MQEKHTKAKETDITLVLVITFVILVAALIAKVAGDFTSTTTSTSSRAGFNKKLLQTQTPNQQCQAKNPAGIYDSTYSSAKDFCPDNQIIGLCGGVLDYTDKTVTCKGTTLGVEYNCCRDAAEVKKLGDSHCQRNNSDTNSKCKSSCGSGESQLASKDCAYVNKVVGLATSLKPGVCCGNLNPTPTTGITPTPFQPVTASSCIHKDGIAYDCTKTFNESGNFGGLTAACVPTSTNVQNPSQGSLTYVCGYLVSKQFSGNVCNGLQTANKVYKADGTSIAQCWVGNKKLPLPYDNNNVACTMMKYGGVNSYSDKQCKDAAGTVSDPSQ
ncbi:MAG: hypothetical protein WA061_05635 [Microgenomates group bacterium]